VRELFERLFEALVKRDHQYKEGGPEGGMEGMGPGG
jgi:hypothetical protein